MSRESSLSFVHGGEEFHHEPLPGTVGPLPLPREVREEFETPANGGKRPYVYHEYPAYRYLYVKGVAPLLPPDEKHPENEAHNRDVRAAMQRAGFSNVHELVAPDLIGRIVKDAAEAASLGPRWTERPEQAKAADEAADAKILELAAERNYTDRRMSPKAKAEQEAHDAAAGFSAVLDPPVPKKRPRGRPVTVKTGVDA